MTVASATLVAVIVYVASTSTSFNVAFKVTFSLGITNLYVPSVPFPNVTSLAVRVAISFVVSVTVTVILTSSPATNPAVLLGVIVTPSKDSVVIV